MNALIRLLYSLLIAGAVVAFIGVGAHTVYPGPEFPDPGFQSFSSNASDEQLNKEQQENDKKWRQFQDKQKEQNKNVTYIVLASAVVVTGLGLLLIKRRSDVVGEGFSLGGVATSLYAVITASMADHDLLRFLAVTLLLVSSVVLAHKRFIEPQTKKSAKKKR